MKIRISTLLIVGGFFISTSALASDGTETKVEIRNNNDQEGNVKEKKSSSYSFTLFSFFNTELSTQKTDSVSTGKSKFQPKTESKKISSNL